MCAKSELTHCDGMGTAHGTMAVTGKIAMIIYSRRVSRKSKTGRTTVLRLLAQPYLYNHISLAEKGKRHRQGAATVVPYRGA